MRMTCRRQGMCISDNMRRAGVWKPGAEAAQEAVNEGAKRLEWPTEQPKHQADRRLQSLRLL